jgi:hypothetical protein
MLLARYVFEEVIGPLEFGFGTGNHLGAAPKFHEVLVRATTEKRQTEQERQSHYTFEYGCEDLRG